MFQEVHGVHIGHAGTQWEQTKHWWPFLFSRRAVCTRMLGQNCHLVCTASPEPAPGSSRVCGAVYNPKYTRSLAKARVNCPLLLPKRKLFQEQLTLALHTAGRGQVQETKLNQKLTPSPSIIYTEKLKLIYRLAFPRDRGRGKVQYQQDCYCLLLPRGNQTC